MLGPGPAGARPAPAQGSALSVWLAAPRPAVPDAGAEVPQVPEPEPATAGEPVTRAEAPAAGTQEGARDERASIPAPAYLPTSVLSRSPRPLTEPVFPPDEGAARAGKVLLELYVSERGDVDEATVIDADLPQVDSQRARDAFRALRFSPGELDGKPVAARMRIEVSFDAAP